MDDREIVELFWQRDERAIAEAESKYSLFCMRVAMNLLQNGQDAEECVNETFFQAWSLIPPERPQKLKPWLGRITRNIAIKVWQKNHAQKRCSAMDRQLDDLEEMLPSPFSMEREIEDRELGAAISRWLRELPREDRKLFVRRYWHGVSVQDLAEEAGVSPNTLAQKMYRLRIDLKTFLEKEDQFHEYIGQGKNVSGYQFHRC